MSAEILRRAAVLMRERAEGADAVTLHRPWDSDGEQVVGGDGGWMLVASTLVAGTDTVVADHIASWHPAVALAVADWLDSVADAHEPPDGGPGNHGRTITIVDDAHAEVIARAYLGDPS